MTSLQYPWKQRKVGGWERHWVARTDSTLWWLHVGAAKGKEESRLMNRVLVWQQDPTLTSSSPTLPKSRNYPSTPLISGLYSDNLGSPLESNSGNIMLWTHNFSPYVYRVIDSDLKKHERQTKLKSYDQISPMAERRLWNSQKLRYSDPIICPVGSKQVDSLELKEI